MEIESFEYNIKVSRDLFKNDDPTFIHGPRVLDFKIIISRDKTIKEKYNAYLEGEVYKNKTDKFKTFYKGNGLWNGLGYKTKEEWEGFIKKYKTLGQLERDFML